MYDNGGLISFRMYDTGRLIFLENAGGAVMRVSVDRPLNHSLAARESLLLPSGSSATLICSLFVLATCEEMNLARIR